MEKKINPVSTVFLSLMTCIFCACGCLPKTTIAVEGVLFGKELNTGVDDSLAYKMLTDPQDASVVDLFNLYREKSLDTKTLSDITEKYSADVATLYFLQKSYQNELNKKAQDLYLTYFENQSYSDTTAMQDDFNKLKEYIVVFVPGLAYKEDTTTGADFARQRHLLTSSGIKNELIEVGEWDLAENNALQIATRLKIISEEYEKIIVVSASKGGLETAIALGKILTPEETKSIKSWINVGGILRGSPVADNYLTFPKCWLAEIMLWTKGKKINTVQDMSYKSRKESFEELEFPKNIKIISFVGAPLATKITREIKSRYCSMIELGPNDGLTPLADVTIENGIIISEIGLDHYFRDKDIDKKTLALALVAVKIQN